MEHETHNDNDQHTIEILNDDDSSSRSSPDVESYSSSGSSLDEESHSSAISSLSTDEETSDEGSSSYTSGCDSLCNTIKLVINLVQIVAAIVASTLAKDEHPQALLLAWLVGYTCGCIASILLILTWLLRKYNQVVENPMTRKDGVVEHLKMGLECFFVVWLVLGIVWICDGHSSSSDAPRLYRLCVVFIVFSCIRFAAVILLCEGESQGSGFVFQGPIHDDCCCICLGKYGEKQRVMKKPNRSLPFRVYRQMAENQIHMPSLSIPGQGMIMRRQWQCHNIFFA